MAIQHDLQAQEFTTTRNGFEAELAYARPAAGVIDFTHTYVDEHLRGQGVGEELARTALAYARAHKFHVKTTCKFMAAFVKKHHEEFADLVD